MRVGLDLVSVAEVEHALSEHGERYLSRVYTAGEVGDCGPAGHPDAQRLAARFAAKEAVIKVLRQGVPWSQIEVVRDAQGWVGLELTGPAHDVAQACGVTSLALSVTHEAGFAAAVVIAELGNMTHALPHGPAQDLLKDQKVAADG